jgi:glycosyltransferase involved in cell wall biosynthesis
MPIVSIVVPLYNKRATLRRTLNSIIMQSFSDFEVLVVDDGSTDGAADFVSDLRDSRFRVIRQANAGPGAAKNRGMREATAGLLSFIDADDEWDPRFLETAVTSLQKYSACDAFTSDIYLGGQRESTQWTRASAAYFSEGPYRLGPGANLQESAAAFSSCGVVYRRNVVIRYGGFFAENRCTFGEDLFLWIRVLLNHTIYRCTTPLGCYHTEDSELAIGTPRRRYCEPIEPVLSRADHIRQNAPIVLQQWLEQWLASHAMSAAFRQLSLGDVDKARWLLLNFPRMRRWRINYVKLRFRMRMPSVYRLFVMVLATPFRARRALVK